MTRSDSYPFSERSARAFQVFGILGKLRILFLAVLVLSPELLLAQWKRVDHMDHGSK